MEGTGADEAEVVIGTAPRGASMPRSLRRLRVVQADSGTPSFLLLLSQVMPCLAVDKPGVHGGQGAGAQSAPGGKGRSHSGAAPAQGRASVLARLLNRRSSLTCGTEQ